MKVELEEVEGKGVDWIHQAVYKVELQCIKLDTHQLDINNSNDRVS
jgi:hypothetical protein